MIRRFMVIQLHESASPEGCARLVSVLEQVPKYIRSVKSSRVGRNLSASPDDLIWEHEFDDLDGFLHYRTHPYHCQVIDEFLGRESPNRINKNAYSFFYDDNESSADTTHIPADRKWAATSIGGSMQPYNGAIFLIEEIQVKPGCTAEYLALFKSIYLPIAIERGMKLTGCWRSADGAVPTEEVVFVWEIEGEGWRKWDQMRAAAGADPRVDDWLAKAQQLRVGGRRRLLEPVSDLFAQGQ